MWKKRKKRKKHEKIGEKKKVNIIVQTEERQNPRGKAFFFDILSIGQKWSVNLYRGYNTTTKIPQAIKYENKENAPRNIGNPKNGIQNNTL